MPLVGGFGYLLGDAVELLEVDLPSSRREWRRWSFMFPSLMRLFAGGVPNHEIDAVQHGCRLGTASLAVAQIIVMTILPSWRSICQLLIGVLMLTQLAIAAHACVRLSRMEMPARESTGAAVGMVDSGPVGPSAQEPSVGDGQGDRMDPTLSNVCVAHCQYGPQNADHAQALVRFPAVLATYFYTLPPLGEIAVSAGLPPEPGRPPVAAEPPHAILHCCWRT